MQIKGCGVVRVIECLLSMHEVLGSSLSKVKTTIKVHIKFGNMGIIDQFGINSFICTVRVKTRLHIGMA